MFKKICQRTQLKKNTSNLAGRRYQLNFKHIQNI